MEFINRNKLDALLANHTQKITQTEYMAEDDNNKRTIGYKLYGCILARDLAGIPLNSYIRVVHSSGKYITASGILRNMYRRSDYENDPNLIDSPDNKVIRMIIVNSIARKTYDINPGDYYIYYFRPGNEYRDRKFMDQLYFNK